MNSFIDGIISLIGVATFGLLIALTTFRWRMKERAIFTLSFYLALGLMWSIGTAVLNLDIVDNSQIGFFSFLANSSRAVMPVIFGALTLAFLTRTKVLYWYWGYSAIILALWAAVRLNINGFGNLILAYLPPSLPASNLDIIIKTLEFLLWGVATLVSLGVVIRSLQKKRQAQFRNRLRYWLGGMLILAVANIIILLETSNLLWLGSSLNIVGAALITYIVMRSHPPDLRVITNRVLRSIMVTSALSVILFGSLYSAYLLNGSENNSQTIPILFLGVAILMAFSLPRLSEILERILTNILLGAATDASKTLMAYNQNVSAEYDLEKLGQQALKFVLSEMGIKQGALFERERDGSGHVTLRLIAMIEMPPTGPGYFFADDPWIQQLRQNQSGITQYDLEVLPKYRSMDENSKDWLAALDVELFFPIILRQQELMGVLALGHKPNHQPYLSAEMKRLSVLSSQIALDMDKAKMFKQLGATNQKLGEMSDKMSTFDQGKTDFLSIASHELRTPLTHIHGYASMLLEATEDELQNPAYLQHVFNGIAKGSNRLKSVVDLIFDVSRADIGEMNLSAGPVSLVEVVKVAVEKEEDTLKQRKHNLVISGVEQLPIINGDMQRLVQAMAHLINNAVKYTPDEGTITITGHKTSENGEPFVELIISDTGIGIDPADHKKIFDKFYRVGRVENHSTSSVKFKGAGPGLGLPLVAGIAIAHGGRVWVKSPQYNEESCPGSQFHFSLPVEATIKEPETAVPELISPSQVKTQTWRREDIEAIRERAAQIEKERGQ